MTPSELEAAYIALTKDVEARAMRIVGLCGAKRPDDAGRAAADLVELVATKREQFAMTRETAAPERYDQNALTVNADMLTNSETPNEGD